ncbi:unnamed protein product [Amoebophrya sp. A120]|nr:unnamed protein product [Amoebophrya sp. A120]|eukprot:GSA120T00011946001.1
MASSAETSAGPGGGFSTTSSSSSSNPNSYNAYFRSRKKSLQDFLEKKVQLNNTDDVVVLDRVKYAPNAGTVLRHMPLFGPAQALFLTQSEDNENYYARGFVKEVLRMAMAFPHAKGHQSRQACGSRTSEERINEESSSSPAEVNDEDESETPTTSDEATHFCVNGDLKQVLHFLKQSGFFLLAIENKEVFEELNGETDGATLSRLRETHTSCAPIEGEADAVDVEATTTTVGESACLPYTSIFELDRSAALGAENLNQKRIAFVFGGESWGLSKEMLRLCDAGAFLPTVEQKPTKTRTESDKIRPRAHTCNLSVAATMVLGERHRQKITHLSGGIVREQQLLPQILATATSTSRSPSSSNSSSRTSGSRACCAGAPTSRANPTPSLSPSTTASTTPAVSPSKDRPSDNFMNSPPSPQAKMSKSEPTPNIHPDDYRVLLFYLYTPLVVTHQDRGGATDVRKPLATSLQDFCDARNISGRLRVAKDGLNGCLGGKESDLLEFTRLEMPEEVLAEKCGVIIKDFSTVHWKWGGCVDDGSDKTKQMMQGRTAVRVCEEVVSLFGDCYRNASKNVASDLSSSSTPSWESHLQMYREQFNSDTCLQSLFAHQKAADENASCGRGLEGDLSGLPPSVPVPALTPAISLTPEAWNERLEKADQAVLLDVRNVYETAVGHFDFDSEQATTTERIDPKTRQFTDFPRFLAQNRKELQEKCKGKEVFAYCTGGVRCERATQLLRLVLEDNEDCKRKRRQSVGDGNEQLVLEDDGATTSEAPRPARQQKIFQLHGGIHAYLQHYPDGGKFFKGKNFVFDNRMVEENFGEEIVGKCVVCQSPWDDYRLNHRCSQCRMRVLVCDGCSNEAAETDTQMKANLGKDTDATEGKETTLLRVLCELCCNADT